MTIGYNSVPHVPGCVSLCPFGFYVSFYGFKLWTGLRALLRTKHQKSVSTWKQSKISQCSHILFFTVHLEVLMELVLCRSYILNLHNACF